MVSTRINRRFFAPLLVGLLASLPATGQPAEVEDSLVLDRWEFQLGGYVTGLDTQIRFDEIVDGGGTNVSLEDDLGFDDNDTVFRLHVAHLFGKRHQLALNYFETQRTGLVTVDEEIQWGDEVLPVGAEIASFYDAEFTSLSYTYWFRSRQKSAIGATFGLVRFSLSSGADVVGRVVGSGASVGTDFSLTVPVPQVGLQYRQALGQRWVLLAGGGFIVFDDIDDFSGDVLTGDLSFEYRAWSKVGLGAAFALRDFDIDSGEKRTLGRYRFEVRGLVLYLRVGL